MIMNVKEYFKDLCEQFEDCEDIKEGLRSLHSQDLITDDEYNYVLENWDNLLVELGYMEQEMLDIIKGLKAWK